MRNAIQTVGVGLLATTFILSCAEPEDSSIGQSESSAIPNEEKSVGSVEEIGIEETGSEVTGSEVTGSEVVDSEVTGSEVTGSEVTGSEETTGESNPPSGCEDLKIESDAYYVDKDHVDAANENDGSKDQPWATIQHGVNQLSPGDTLYVRASEEPYFEPYRASGNDKGGITIDVSGTESDRVVVAGYPGERPVVDQQRAESSLSAEDGSPDSEAKILTGFYLRDASYVTIRNFEIREGSASGVMLNQYDENESVIVEGNHIHHIYGNDNVGGVRLDNCNNCIVRNNRIHDTYSTRNISSNPFTEEPYSMHSGVHGYRPGNSIIENNTIYNVAKGVFQKSPDPEELDANTVRYNLLYNLSDAAFVIGVQGAGSPPSYNASFYGNIVHDAANGVEVLLHETDEQSKGLKIFNNTFYDVEEAAASIRGYHGIEFYNNIVARTDFANFITVDPSGPPEGNTNEVDIADYNIYFDHAERWLIDRYGASQNFDSLDTWQTAFGEGEGLGLSIDPGANSQDADPEFVDADGLDFHLESGSPAEGSGSNGENIGAYGVTETVGATCQ